MSLIEYQSDQCLGIRTRARVAKGVKEDQKKTKPRKIIKSKKYSSESDLCYDRFRVNSNLGGQSNTSLNAKPKIFRHFRKLKRKKLYCPIKHCVRIQIPRKGYFYRSTVRFKAPGSAPSMQRVESSVVPQSKSKVQIPRLASTSSKGPNLLKKRLKNQRKDAKLVAQSAAPPIPSSPARLEPPNFAPLIKDLVICGLVHSPPKGVPPNAPEPIHPPNHIKPSGKPRPRTKGQHRISAASENQITSNNPKTNNQLKKKCKAKPKGSKKPASSEATDDTSEALETSSERIISITKSDILTPPPSETSFNTLLTCISKILGKDEGFYDLQITPVRTGGGKFSLENDFQPLPDSTGPPQNLQITEVVTAFDNPCEDVHITEVDGIYLSPTASTTFQDSNNGGDFEMVSEDNIARILFGEIDLHLELENYLREIECFNTEKNGPKNALQRNLYEDYFSPDECSFEPQNPANQFFEITEIKSNSTFGSATSLCTQQDGDTNKLHVFLDRKHDMGSLSEEHLDSRNTKVFISQTQFTDKVSDIRKIKSDNDPKKIQQETKLKSSIKRTFGKTSFQPSRQDDDKTWVLPPLQNNPSTDSSVDSYEKILPFGRHSNKSCHEVKRLSSLLYTNSVYSLSAESFPTTVRKSASDSNQCSERKEPMESVKSLQLQLPEESSSNSVIFGAGRKVKNAKSKRHSWSPSLQELIEIYNNVLKHNKKIRSNSRPSVSRCISSHLFSFLKDELREKESKANLVMLSKNLNRKLKAPEVWKPGRQKKDNTLEDYVTMFQEILKSSLSISQIARLNNIISGLQEYSEKNYDFVKSLDAKRRESKMKNEGELPRTETPPAEEKAVGEKDPPVLPPLKKPKKKLQSHRAIRAVRPSSAGKCQVKRKKAQTPPPKAEEVIPVEEVTKIELTSPRDLESILQSCFAAEELDRIPPRDPNDKILVTVKLRGNQVLVSRLSYFKNEEALSPEKPKQNGTTELIIENVTKDQVKDVWRKKTKTPKSRESKKLAELEKPKIETSVRPEPKKVKRNSKTSTPAPTTPKKESCNRTRDNCFSMRQFQEPEIPLPFEYDQMQLRAQHPIEAIIESSESKVSEHVENSDEEQSHSHLEPPPEKKIHFKDIHRTNLKEAVKEALAENVYSKDLNCDLSWTDQKLLNDNLNRTKSYVINRETLKKQILPKKPLKDAETVRSLSDLINKPKFRRKPRRKSNSYMCYPSILNLQRKPVALKKKLNKQVKQKNRSAYTSNSRIAPSNCTLCSQQQGVSTRSSKEFGSKILISEVESYQMSPLSAARKDFYRTAKKVPVEALTSDSDEVVLDCCSMELLYYDEENPSPSVTPKVSASTVKPTTKTTSSEQVALPPETKAPNWMLSPSAITVDYNVGSPTVIHPPRNVSDDTIFRSVLIHSDSFIKSFSSLPLTHGNLTSLLKSSSDMKFYPGRVSSSDKSQQNPFVKFVLTPSQNANAGLPPNQVQIVDKKLAAEDAVVECFKTEKANPASADVDEKVSLVAIEKFIKKLSKSKRKAKPKPQGAKKPETAKSTPTSKSGEKRKSPVPALKSSPRPTDRKPYHECQKRRLNDKDKAPDKKLKSPDRESKTPERKSKPADSKTKLGKEKTVKEPPKESSENLEVNLISLKKFVVTLSQIMESYENLSKEKAKIQEEQKREAAGGGGPAVIEPEPEGVSSEGHLEKATNTTPDAKCSLTRVSDTPPKAVQDVKSAVTQTDDVPAASQDKVWEREPDAQKVCEKDSCTPKGPREPNPTRKPKTLKIKIHCDDRSHCRDGSKGDKTGQTENPVADTGKLQHPTDKLGLLDSLVTAEPERGALERKNSTYFDALEMYSDDECDAARPKGKKDNSQQEFLAYWATVGREKGRGGLDMGEKSDRGSSSLKSPPEGPAERAFDEILRSLQDGKIYHSLTLLDDFLQKAECAPSLSGNSDRLRNVLLLVSSQSKDLLMGMEKNAWVKVLSLLEDLSQTFGSENAEGSPKAFVGKIQGLNDRRLVDLQNFCSALTQTSVRSNNRINTVFCRLKDTLNYLRKKMSAQRIQPAKSDHSVAETPDHSEENPLRHLRKQIQRQKTYIEFLLSADCCAAPQEIQDVKGKVVEKMRNIGKILSAVSCGMAEGPEERAPRGARSPLGRGEPEKN